MILLNSQTEINHTMKHATKMSENLCDLKIYSPKINHFNSCKNTLKVSILIKMTYGVLPLVTSGSSIHSFIRHIKRYNMTPVKFEVNMSPYY